ncbi:MAG: hypothetical protein IKW99_06250 [Bacteroidales bacterium]|nr:hypothetical protein [Bacteroidales bacterium]
MTHHRAQNPCRTGSGVPSVAPPEPETSLKWFRCPASCTTGISLEPDGERG